MDDDRELGKLEYWEQLYADERRNYANYGDEGEVWFGEDILDKLIEWITNLLRSKYDNPQQLRVLDIGCGNGHFLMDLHSKGFRSLVGIDYSENSITLCRDVTEAKGISEIQFRVENILETTLTDQFDFIFDKGTLDAITLSINGEQKRAAYVSSVSALLEDGGIFVITSCNWTVDEVRDTFSTELRYLDHIKDYPSFSFGGSEGTTVSTVAFQRLLPQSAMTTNECV